MAVGTSRGWICRSCQLALKPYSKTNSGQQRRVFSQQRVAHVPAQQAPPRPTNAPQQTPNVNHLKNNQKAYEENCLKRRYLHRAEEARNFHKDYARVVELRAEVQESKKELRALEKRIGALQAQSKSEDINEEVVRLKRVAQQLKHYGQVSEKERLLAEAEERVHAIALAQPSLTSPQTPFNNTTDANGNPTSSPKLLEYLNYDPDSPPSRALKTAPFKSHTDIGSDLSLLDFSAATATTGWGWYYLKSTAALLEQALVQYALSVLVRRGWTIVSPPSIVYSHIAESCGFQPRDQNDEQQIYEISPSTRDIASGAKPTRSLAATAEIPLASLLASQTLSSSSLPLKVAGVSRCYRAEAGARGVSSKGLYRVHEFSKVEMFAWTDSPSSSSVNKTTAAAAADPLTDPESYTSHSLPVFDEMLAIQKEILTSLHLPCRVLEMPISDLGASAWRKIDIEAFFPSRYRRPQRSQGSNSSSSSSDGNNQDAKTIEEDEDNGWGELTSISMCTDYQTRRLGTRVKDDDGSSKPRFAQTINGTAMAVPRVLAALLEYGYREGEGGGKGRVEIPEVLKRYMPGHD